ncbi:MAG: hypothetical protein H6907_10950 [Hyphomicrobiales bacterium]|nr:hypothetical protein [Hyphomicrobiales bacterium]
MPEPEPLKRGKAFQKVVQADFRDNSRDGKVFAERSVAAAVGAGSRTAGRMDVFVGELDGYAVILEIKATDWDRIKPANVRRNLWRHQRQLFRYIDTFMDGTGLDVCLGVIYPEPPRTPGLRARIEAILEDYGTPAYWFPDIRGPA